MNIFLIVLLVAVCGFFVWQLALLIRDIVKKVKSKKSANVDNSADESANEEKKGE